MTILHRNRFVEYQPFLNTHIAVSSRSGLLAVAREHSIVDIFSISANFAHFRRFVALPDGLSMESMCFVTFSSDNLEQLDLAFNPKRDQISAKPHLQYELLAVASMDGLVRIISPRTARVMCFCDTHGGGAAWSVCSLGEGKLAVGCHDGSVRLFSLSNDGLGLDHLGVFDRASEGRVRRLAFCPKTKLLAAAMDNGFVRIIDIVSGKSVGQFQTEEIVPTAIEWSENGDSLFVGLISGKLLIIDPMTCQPRLEMSHHIAAIQSIVACGTSDVFVSGVDHRTLHLSRESSQSTTWLRSGQRRICHNDVIGMSYVVIAGKPMLIQGCCDGSLRVVNPFNFDSKMNDRCISGLSVRPIIRTTKSHLVANLGLNISVWTVGAFDKSTECVVSEPELLATIKFDEPVIALDVTDEQLAVQLPGKVKLYNIVDGHKFVKDQSFRSSADLICFAAESTKGHLYACEQVAKGCRVVCDGQEIALIETNSFAIRMVCCKKYLSIALGDSSVYTVELQSKRLRKIEFDCPVIAMNYNEKSDLICYTVNHECFVVDGGGGKKKQIAVPQHWPQKHDAIQGLVGRPLFAWSEFGVCRLGDDSNNNQGRQLKMDGSEDEPFQSIIHFDFIGDDEAVIVERPWRDIMPNLPAATQVPKYGQQ